MDKKVQSIKWLYLTVFLLPVLAMAQEKETKIDEVVLVGYTKVSKKDVTNSVSSVKAEAIKICHQPMLPKQFREEWQEYRFH